MRRAAVLLTTLFAGAAGMTWWALESSGVAIIETRTAEGAPRSTHVWFVDVGGELWLEAGTPENPWFQDVLRAPRVEISIGGVITAYDAAPVSAPGSHGRIRAALREKYGLRDAWVGILVDTSRSVAVRLTTPSPSL